MNRLSRRDLVSSLALLTAAPSLARAQIKRPNILLVLADDWGWTSSRPVDELGVKMPNFDRVRRMGVSFDNAFSAAPTCTASRGAILTGRPPWQLEEGANLASILPAKFDVYPDIFEKAGYAIGFCDKGWAPGQLKPAGRTRNPAGPRFDDFPAFLAKTAADKPFCFWLGAHDPHRPYEVGQGAKNGVTFTRAMPPYMPDSPAFREDIADYMFAVQAFDRILGEALAALEAKGELNNTLVVVTGDNGPSFTHSKATLYDPGTHVPMAAMWPGKIKPGQTSQALVVLTDLAPTFLEAAGLPRPANMVGKSLLPLMTRGGAGPHAAVVTAMERHMDGHGAPGQGYPMRALRTDRYLYIRNFQPDRWPAGDPNKLPPDPKKLEVYNYAGFANIGPGPSKVWLVLNQKDPQVRPFFNIATAKHPAQELFDVTSDPYQLKNLAGDPKHARLLARMDAQLMATLRATGDPRAGPDGDIFDRYPSYSDPGYGRPDNF